MLEPCVHYVIIVYSFLSSYIIVETKLFDDLREEENWRISQIGFAKLAKVEGPLPRSFFLVLFSIPPKYSFLIFYFWMQGHKSNPTTSQSPRPKNIANSLAPYDQLPVKLRFHHMRPFSQLLNNSQYCLQRREKVRDITHKTLERDFRATHELNHNKEAQMLKTFKIRCKRKDQNNKKMSNQEFFMGQLEKRQHQLRKLNEEYLSVLRQQLGKVVKSQDRQQQKLINQYNIIYEYRADKVPNPLKIKDK